MHSHPKSAAMAITVLDTLLCWTPPAEWTTDNIQSDINLPLKEASAMRVFVPGMPSLSLLPNTLRERWSG